MLRPSECAAIVTAAGLSTRMGALKPLLPWRGVPLVRHQCERLSDFQVVVVVVGHRADEVRAALEGAPENVRPVLNPAYREGRSGSFEVGAAALPRSARAVLVVAVDQPLERITVEALVAAFDPEQYAYAQPVHAGHGGHPLLLSAALAAELRRASAFPLGLRDIVRAHSARCLPVEVADSGIHRDLNEPLDWVE